MSGGPHQRLADQHRPHPGRLQPRQVGVRPDPALADHAPGPAGIFGSRSSVCSSGVVNVRRSRLLMPMSVAPQSITRGNWSASCSSTSACSPSAGRLREQRREPVAGQDLGDQQDRVGPGGPGFEQLVAVEDEVLPQDRHADGLADRGEVRRPPWKNWLVRQHADAVRPVPLVGAGDGDRVEVGADHPGRRGRLLHLGDHRASPGPRSAPREVAGRRAWRRPGAPDRPPGRRPWRRRSRPTCVATMVSRMVTALGLPRRGVDSILSVRPDPQGAGVWRETLVVRLMLTAGLLVAAGAGPARRGPVCGGRRGPLFPPAGPAGRPRTGSS